MPTRNISLNAQHDALKLRTLRQQIKAGAEALRRGDFIEIADPALDTYLEHLTDPPP